MHDIDIIKIIDDQIQDIECIILSGSHASNTATSTSDYDIVVTRKGGDDIIFWSDQFLDKVFEICELPVNHVEKFIVDSRRNRKAPILFQIQNGKLLQGPKQKFNLYKMAAEKIISKGPLPISKQESADIQYELSTLHQEILKRNGTQLDIVHFGYAVTCVIESLVKLTNNLHIPAQTCHPFWK